MTIGANRDDFHLRGVDMERDISIDEWADLRTIVSGDACPKCETGILEVFKALEIGHIFKLGTKYSESMGATVLNHGGQEVPDRNGQLRHWRERIMAAAIELHYDEHGIIWPKSIAPFDVVITITNVKQPNLLEAAESLYAELQAAGLDVLLDEGDERAGVKFNDANLIGIPVRLNIGRRTNEGIVEFFDRNTRETEEILAKETLDRIETFMAGRASVHSVSV
jgi:prolyl-tRNA synthetase